MEHKNGMDIDQVNPTERTVALQKEQFARKLEYMIGITKWRGFVHD